MNSEAKKFHWDLSPDGSHLAFWKTPQAPIEILSLNGDATRSYHVKGWDTSLKRKVGAALDIGVLLTPGAVGVLPGQKSRLFVEVSAVRLEPHDCPYGMAIGCSENAGETARGTF